ncbi:MAG TPA: hypothetical protein VFH74_01865 [Gaiellales bacterium]|nr:hypothetical protein [Gaiellales bacterium]
MHRSTILIIALVLTPAASACGMGGASASSTPSPAARMSTAERFRGAEPAVEAYVRAVALNRPLDAQRVVQPASTFTDQQTLTGLTTWFGRLPIGAVRMKAHPVRVPDADAVGVRVSIEARFSPRPLSTWIKLGDRVMLAHWFAGGWKVEADISGRPSMHLRDYGLGLFDEPTVLTGDHTTVIYEASEARDDATQILSDADEVVPRLTALFGRDRSAAHPVIFIVDSKDQGEALSGARLGRAEVPQGFVLNGVCYIDWPEWEPGNVIERDGTIAHELTHVASWGLLGRAPHSLMEGLAMVEEDRFLRGLGYHIPLGDIASAYARGFPSISFWRTRITDWSQTNPAVVNLGYEDGQAMTAVILQHFGAGGVARLARAYTAMHASHHDLIYSEDQVREAFQRGLGVSFDQVVAWARAYAAANAR